MKRRAFITLLGGAAAAPLIGPAAARAQQPAAPVIGFLRSTAAATATHLVAAFRKGLAEAGLVEGQNIAIEYRWADNDRSRLPALAAELVRRPVDVIVGNYSAMPAVMAATKSIPVVFVSGADPVRAGLVQSLNRPGGNVTGISFFGGPLNAKRMELLHELIPKPAGIALLYDPAAGEIELELRQTEQSARALGRELIMLRADNDPDLASAFKAIEQKRPGAMLIGSGAFLTNAKRRELIDFAARQRIVAVYAQRASVVAGGLMSYGNSQPDAYRQAAGYVARILKGEKPADLPVMQPTHFELVINLKTAKALGLQIPPTLLARADEVIE
jgi:putative ABC transport system substrate-binding protein